MAHRSEKLVARDRRHERLRKRVIGTTDRPRMAVFRSNRHVSVQVIDDVTRRTLASASTLDKDLKGSRPTVEGAKKVGATLATKAKAKGVKKVVFDRGGFKYHGVIKSLADAAREAGLEF